jgi:hypothetical protein
LGIKKLPLRNKNGCFRRKQSISIARKQIPRRFGIRKGEIQQRTSVPEQPIPTSSSIQHLPKRERIRDRDYPLERLNRKGSGSGQELQRQGSAFQAAIKRIPRSQ